MKKFLLIAALTALTGSAMAQELSFAQDAPTRKAALATAPQKAPSANGYDLAFFNTEGQIQWMGLNFNNVANPILIEYVAVPAEVATQLAGNKITSLSFSVSFEDAATMQTRYPVTIFVTESLDGEYNVSKEVQARDGYLYRNENPLQTEAFDEGTEYEIKADTGFFYGIKMNPKADWYPYCVDEGPYNTAVTSHMDLYNGTQYVGSYQMPQIGNLAMVAASVGEKKSLENVFSVGDAYFPDFALPSSSFTNSSVLLEINNIGSNAITTIDYTIQFNDEEPETTHSTLNFPASTNSGLKFDIENFPKGYGTLTLTVNKLNNVEVGESSTLEFYNFEEGEGYDRKFVVEEGTGTWCSWCPRGIVGLETMYATYPEQFIGIAVHVNDSMQVESYMPFAMSVYSAFPGCIINRDYNFNVDPSASELQKAYNTWSSQKSPVLVDLNVDYNESVMTATASTTFCIDNPNANYSLAFVIMEDGIKDIQLNSYAGGRNGACGGWETKPQRVQWIFEHTARDIKDAWGIEGSMPEAVEKGKTYEYKTDIPLANVTDVEQTQIVAMVLDNATGVILNADKKNWDNTHVENLFDVDNATMPVEYFNLQGVRVNNPQPGDAVISRQGGKVQKMIIR